ncbi:MAG: hypothetical protein FWD94_00255 [Treponema sp.]|nr:hypothetical protein [Treponema sp.]
MSEIKSILENNTSDNIASAIKLYSNIFPGLGSLLGEIICNYIPNQRLDRVTKYLSELNDTVEKLSDEIKTNKDKINLIETGLKVSANSTFNEKCEWIANIVLKGLCDDIEIPTAESIINIVSQLNYEQIIVLYYYVKYYSKPWVEKIEFTNKYKYLFDFGHLISENRKEFDMLKNKEKYNFKILGNLGLLEIDYTFEKLPSFGISSPIGINDIKMLQHQLYELNDNLIKYFQHNNYKPTDLGLLVIKNMGLQQ